MMLSQRTNVFNFANFVGQSIDYNDYEEGDSVASDKLLDVELCTAC